MCVVANDKEFIKKELDTNRNELINSIECAGVVLRCLTSWVKEKHNDVKKKDSENDKQTA